MKSKTTSFLLKFATILFLVAGLVACNTESTSSETANSTEVSEDFQISLAQWSLHKSYFGDALTDWQSFGKMLMESPDDLLQGELDPNNFPNLAASYGIHTIELVNTFYFSKANDVAFWAEFKEKCDEAGVNVWLIMCDALGNLGDADAEARMAAVEKHHAWVDIAKSLGASAIRVNAAGQGTAEEVAANAADGLSNLGEYGASQGIDIIVENHGGYSSNGEWLAGVMATVGMDNVGTLPDFGNFCIERTADGCANEYDRYQGMTDLMPYAKGVSAKSHEFDENGNEIHTDFYKMLTIAKEAGFKGYVGVEYEGTGLTEDEGIKATKALLEKVIAEI